MRKLVLIIAGILTVLALLNIGVGLMLQFLLPGGTVIGNRVLPPRSILVGTHVCSAFMMPFSKWGCSYSSLYDKCGVSTARIGCISMEIRPKDVDFCF